MVGEGNDGRASQTLSAKEAKRRLKEAEKRRKKEQKKLRKSAS